MYAAQCTRPDIAYSVGALSRYNNNPGNGRWNAVKRVLRYLKKTKDWKLTYKKTATKLTGHADSGWASYYVDTRCSTSGYVFILGSGAVSWNLRKQPTVALSSTEAEYMSQRAAAQKAIWLRGL